MRDPVAAKAFIDALDLELVERERWEDDGGKVASPVESDFLLWWRTVWNQSCFQDIASCAVEKIWDAALGLAQQTITRLSTKVAMAARLQRLTEDNYVKALERLEAAQKKQADLLKRLFNVTVILAQFTEGVGDALSRNNLSAIKAATEKLESIGQDKIQQLADEVKAILADATEHER
jgi:hypothetical protein